MLKPTKKLKFLIPVLLFFLFLILVLSSCTGNKDEESSDTILTEEKSPGTVWTDLSEDATSYTFQNAVLSIDYETEWRISAKTDSSMVLTHKENPGNILLSTEWTEIQGATSGELVDIYRNQLDITSDEVEKMENIQIGRIDAERYVSMISGNNRESIVSMHVLFISGKRAYLVMFSANPDDFVTYIAHANQVISTIRINGG
ncbi:hypothetical protein ACFLXY_00030 [Chloroflexota bacterium]